MAGRFTFAQAALALVIALFLLVFLAIPVFTVIYAAFTSNGSFTLSHFQSFFHLTLMREAFYNSLYVGGMSVVISSILALREPPSDAKRSVTHVKPIAALKGATLIECRLETGRQHQIRIHLAELGHRLVGERVYIRDYTGARIEAPRTMLHARTLGFAHPRSGERVSFEREVPEDFQAMVELLRP